MFYTRREFGKIALGALPAAALLLKSTTARAAASANPNSTWAGVRVGLNVPYSLGTRTAMNGEQILARCRELGVSNVELRAQAIEASLGLPSNLLLGPAPSDYEGVRTPVGEIPGDPARPAPSASAPPSATAGTGGGTAGGRMPRTPEELAAYKATAAELRQWRLSLALNKAKELRQKYEEGGVAIRVVKFDGIADLEGEELDYAFTLAKALGARAISGELLMRAAKRLSEAAGKHQLYVAHHAHAAGTTAVYEQALNFGKFSAANLDIGHFVAGTNTSPLDFMKRYHDRITHVHVKDRMKNLGPNVRFGEGDTPVKQVLQAIRDNRWAIDAIVEFEIPLPPTVDRTPEILKSLQYCKECLVG
jgi:sugar phosphate isomerase/epimerase